MSESVTCPQCLTEDEGEPRPVALRGLCIIHYRRGLKTGEIARRYAPRGSLGECSVAECSRRAKAHGLCSSHLARQYRGADPAVGSLERAPDCSFEGCGRPNSSKGLCAGHAAQRRAGKPLTALRPYVRRTGECRIDLCSRTVANDGLCQRHYQRKIEGDPNWDRPEIKPKAANGAGHIDKNGYRVIYDPDVGRSRFEHVVIFERLLGRRLQPGESVHHRRGDRADNRTDGPPVMSEDGKLRSGRLELWSSAQPAGQEIGPKVDWALEILETYGQFLDAARRERLRDVSASLAGGGDARTSSMEERRVVWAEFGLLAEDDGPVRIEEAR